MRGKGEAKEDVAEAKQSPEVRRIATAKQREAWQRHYTALDCITWGGRGKARKSLAKAWHSNGAFGLELQRQGMQGDAGRGRVNDRKEADKC